MKRVLTILLSLVMLFSVGMSTTTAMAKDPIISPETTAPSIIIVITLNGENSIHTNYNQDTNNPSVITFTYSGDGILVGWDFPYGKEGVDYIILSQDETSITVQVLDAFEGDTFWANAVDEYPKDVQGDSENNEGIEIIDKDNSTKSPKTGATTGLGIATAGLAILIASRKRK